VDHYPPDETHQPIAAADVLVYGHTHTVVNEDRDGVLHLNAGECCGWVTGNATIAVLDTDKRQAKILNVD
jgi:putative phosphoesterase